MVEEQNPKWVPQLLAWYDVNKRDLPWRDCGDPYKIWVSEVMSQQTRIEAMKPYYDNWMQLFPTLQDLANATEDEAVHAWQGLGYYSRARNLRLGVQEVVNKYGGVVPSNRKDIESLKGVGSYTAGAILSMAYGKREAAVDGNVLRIYARLYGVYDDILSTKGKKAITELVEATLPHDRPGDFNQSLMDFGSAVCIPKSPRCSECPIRNMCYAYQNNVTDQLPVRIKKTKVIDVPVWVGILQYGDYYLLHKRPNRGLLRSMWEFPSLEGANSFDEAEQGLAELVKALGFTLSLKPVMAKELTHIFSHRKWFMKAFKGDLDYVQPIPEMSDSMRYIPDDADIITYIQQSLPKDWMLIKRQDFANYTWAGPHGKLTELCR